MEYILRELNTNDSLRIAYELGNLEVDEKLNFKAKLKWVRPFGMLVTASSIKQIRNRYKDIPFNLEYNQNHSGVNYAGHMGFFKSISEKIDVGKMPGEANGNDNYIPITELDFSKIHNDEIDKGKFVVMGEVIEQEASRLAKVLSRDDKEMHTLLTYLIREILRNIPEHADVKQAWICGQYWSDKTAEIAIVDDGIGIKESLRKNKIHREYIETDEDALKFAIKAGISQAFQPSRKNKSEDEWANSGFGLYMVSEICKELQGSFVLASGNKYIKINQDGEMKLGETLFKGTAVKVTISTNKILKSRQMISKIAMQGEQQAKLIRNAFKKASKPSRGIINEL
jgi:hypothetical protein